ncbi:hypothetical protein Syun_013006 [Stephania yunnanensis]|uniref:GDT1 family protein n=1 Tax=Stephania yunnanensis TaxID=152371 RepID=A0AAP0PJZ9_9MAGN
MVMDWIRLRRGIFLVILVAVAFSASVSAQIELESLEHGKWGDKNDQKLVIRDAAGGEIPASSGLGIFYAFFASLSMILVSEIGDETFIIAALMAMRHPKSIVLSGALAALIVMTRPALGGIINGIEPEVLVEVFFPELVRFPLDGFFCGFTALNRGFYELLEILS